MITDLDLCPRCRSHTHEPWCVVLLGEDLHNVVGQYNQQHRDAVVEWLREAGKTIVVYQDLFDGNYFCFVADTLRWLASRGEGDALINHAVPPMLSAMSAWCRDEGVHLGADDLAFLADRLDPSKETNHA